jgi:tetratricopeptide (TPR) repeat protein
MPELSALDGEAGPALPLSPAAFALLVERIEQQFVVPKPVLRAPRRFVPRRLVVGSTLLAASAAAAVYGVSTALSDRAPDHHRASEPAAPAVPVPNGQNVAATAPTDPARSEPPPPARSEQGDSQNELPNREPQGPQAALPEVVSPVAPSVAGSADSGRPKATLARSAAADRLAAANALRAEHRYREALALYSEVIELYPNSMQASVSRVAAAEIRLERFGDIDGAERLYREAKTKGGELTAEAQFGIAQVFRARSDAAGERRALQEFVARHPESPLVSAAERRLQALGAP